MKISNILGKRATALGTLSSLWLVAGAALAQPSAPDAPAQDAAEPLRAGQIEPSAIPAAAPTQPPTNASGTQPSAIPAAAPTHPPTAGFGAQTPSQPAAQPTPGTALEPAIPAVAARHTDLPKKDVPAPALASGEVGNLRVSGLLQVWALYQHQQGISADGEHASTMRLRRAEIKLSGELVPKKFSFGVMIDPAKLPRFGSASVLTPSETAASQPGTATVLTTARDNSPLQDFWVTYQTAWFDITAGQFKTPLSYESNTSSAKLLFPERSLVARSYGEQREMGIKIEKKFEYFGFALGAYNGSGINRTDDNMQKDVALRVEAYPIQGVTLGAVGYTSLGQRDTQASTKDRVEGDVAVNLGDLVVQGEYIHGWDGRSRARTEGAGWYALAGYTFAKIVQPVVRVGQFDRNVETDDDTLSVVEAGLNFYVLKDSVKLQAAYLHTGSQARGVTALNEAILAGQYKF
jgi:hypothetical protein